MKRAALAALVAVAALALPGCDAPWLPTVSKTVTCTATNQQVELMAWNEQESWNGGDEHMRISDSNAFAPGSLVPDTDGQIGNENGPDATFVGFLFAKSDTGTYHLWADIEWLTNGTGSPHHGQRITYDLVLTGCT